MKKILIIVMVLFAVAAHAKDGLNVESWEPLQVIVTDPMPNIVVINGEDMAIDPEFRIYLDGIERTQIGTLFTPGNDIRVQPFD